MVAIPQQIPVEQQAEAVVAVPANRGRVRPLRPIRCRQLYDFSRLLLDLNRDRFPLTHPTRNHAQPALKGRRPGILHRADHQACAQRVGARLSPFAGPRR